MLKVFHVFTDDINLLFFIQSQSATHRVLMLQKFSRRQSVILPRLRRLNSPGIKVTHICSCVFVSVSEI